ncbi:MAG: hypothetical protein WBD79_22790, partial [Anaerolineae bacterium]
ADYVAKWDGSNWSALGSNGAGNGSLSGSVNVIAISGTDVYVGGSFLNVNNNGTSLPAADYVAKWNGSAWSALGTGSAGNGSINGVVSAIAISGTDVYVGGNFYNVNNNATSLPEADYVAKWDGTNWSSLGSNGAGDGSLNSGVFAIVVSGTDVYVGGGFSNGGSAPAADYIGKWNGSAWSALGSNGVVEGSFNGTARAIAVSGTNVYVGGSFTNVSNNGTVLTAADYIAKWDGSNWSALGSGSAGNGSINGTVYAIAISGTDVYVGGTFADVNNAGTSLPEADYIAKWNGSAWSALGSNGASGGSLTGAVYTIAISGTDVYVGGGFFNITNGGISLPEADYIAKWNGSAWSALGSNGASGGSLSGQVNAITISGTDVYVGGTFTDVNNDGTPLPEADYIAKWDGSNWSALGSGSAGNGSLSGRVNAIAISGTNMYVGGGFTNVNNGGTSLPEADYVAKWNGSAWSALGSGIAGNGSLNGSVLAILVSGTDVYVGGAFTNVSNETSLPAADYVAKWDGTNWSALGSNGASNGSLNYGVYALAPGSEDLYVGGDFTNANNGGIAITDADYFAAYGFTPLAAGLADFTVQVQEQGILVAWETTSELGNLGFDLWRGETPNAPTQRLNAALIPSQAPGSSQGFSYAWLDQNNLVMGVTYYYWLDVVEFSGAHERHGPLSATWQAPTALVLDSFTASPGSLGQRMLAWLWRLLAQ